MADKIKNKLEITLQESHRLDSIEYGAIFKTEKSDDVYIKKKISADSSYSDCINIKTGSSHLLPKEQVVIVCKEVKVIF